MCNAVGSLFRLAIVGGGCIAVSLVVVAAAAVLFLTVNC
jgi:hypothetical protein